MGLGGRQSEFGEFIHPAKILRLKVWLGTHQPGRVWWKPGLGAGPLGRETEGVSERTRSEAGAPKLALSLGSVIENVSVMRGCGGAGGRDWDEVTFWALRSAGTLGAVCRVLVAGR